MKIGLAQIDIVWEDKEKNKIKCKDFIKQAAAKEIDILIFPEMTLTGFSMNVKNTSEKNRETVEWFSRQARENNISLGFGHVVNKGQKGQNSFTIVDNKGTLLVEYAKIHPFSYGNENKYFLPGNAIYTCNYNNINITPFICYDLRFPEIFQIASYNTHVFFVAANWPEARRMHWETLLKARAIENQSYVVAVNRVGEGDSIKYSGDSMVIDPLGNIICHSEHKEDLLVSDINISNIISLRSSFNIRNDRKEKIYIEGFNKILKK